MKLLRHVYIHTGTIISINAAFFHPHHNHHHHVSTTRTTTTTTATIHTNFQMLNSGRRKKLNRMMQLNMIKKKKKQHIKKPEGGGGAKQNKGDVVAVVLEEPEIEPETKTKSTAVTANPVKGKNNKGKEEQNSKIDVTEKEEVDQEEAAPVAKQKKEKEVTATKSKKEMKSVSARFMYDNDLYLTTDEEGRVVAKSKIPEDEKVDIAVDSDASNSSSDGVTNDEINDQTIKGEKDHDENQNHGKQQQQQGETKSSKKSEEKNTSIKNVEKVDLPTVEAAAATPIKSPNKKKSENRTIKIPGITLPTENKTKKPLLETVPKPVISGEFNVVLTHCTADFDSLASAVGLAKLWSSTSQTSMLTEGSGLKAFESSSALPTFVVLPRGAHPSVQRFLGLHKHLFPIRSLRSLPKDLSKLHRLGLVDAQSRDRIGPAEILIGEADRVTIVDHHIDGTSDITEATDYIIDKVGAVSTMVAEKLRQYGAELSEAEATLLALGIHADTGSLCFDSSTTRDAEALAWVMSQGASQAAIAEHAHSKLSREQQGVLTNALINTNSTVVHGVTVSTVLLSADGFINGLAAVTQDALELSSSDVFLLSVVYDPKSGARGGARLQSKLLKTDEEQRRIEGRNNYVMEAEAWKGGEKALKLLKLRTAFDEKDADGSGYLDEKEIYKALSKSGIIASDNALKSLMSEIDTDGDGKIDFDEFVAFSEKADQLQKDEGKKAMTMIVIGRVKAGINMKHVNLNDLFQQFGGGGHAKAASCTVRLEDESTAANILQGIVDELIEKGLMQQPTVGDFMTSPVLSAKPSMTEKQVEDLFVRYDVRALPVVDDNNDVVGLVTYKEVAAAKQRLWNKEQKRLRQEAEKALKTAKKNKKNGGSDQTNNNFKQRKLGSALKGWMKQHVKTVEASMTMAEVEQILLENDVGCIPVVADDTTQLVGMVTRTDLLRQHRYYQSLHYNNKGFADSIAARKPIIELRKKLKQFDLDE